LSLTMRAEGQLLLVESATFAAVSKRWCSGTVVIHGQLIGPAALDQACCSSFFLPCRRIYFGPDAVESEVSSPAAERTAASGVKAVRKDSIVFRGPTRLSSGCNFNLRDSCVH
jgi:hypothetical protein